MTHNPACVSQAWLSPHMTLPSTTSPLIFQTLPQAQIHHCIFFHLYPELGARERFCTPGLIPQFSTQLHSRLREVSSSLEQAGSTHGSFSKCLRHSKKQQLLLRARAWLFAWEQEGAQGQPPHPGQSQVVGPELLGSSAFSPWLGGQAPSPWRMIPEAAFHRSLCRVHQPCCNSSQQLSPAALQ